MTGGGQHGVNGIAGTVCKIIAAHAVLGLEMTDHWFDGGAPPTIPASASQSCSCICESGTRTL